MSKIIAGIYSVLILFQSFNINIEDISKFSALLDHAKYHKEFYGDSFLEFLSEHYGSKMASHENKHSGHENLPFKDHQHVLCHLNASFIITPQTNYVFKQQEYVERPLNFFYKEPLSFFEKPSVFQPPKIA